VILFKLKVIYFYIVKFLIRCGLMCLIGYVLLKLVNKIRFCSRKLCRSWMIWQDVI